MPRPNFFISKDNPAYYLTSVAKDRLPVFRRVEIAAIVCKAINEARKSGGVSILALRDALSGLRERIVDPKKQALSLGADKNYLLDIAFCAASRRSFRSKTSTTR